MAFLVGTPINDRITGTSGDDSIFGVWGNDTLSGGAGDDEVFGSFGSDSLVGGTGNDTLGGGDQNDTLVGGAGADRLDGGDGSDTVDYSTAQQISAFFGITGVFSNLMTGEGALGDAAGDTYVDVENIRGSSFNDMLIGTDFANRIDGGLGNDSIMGNFGADTLDGGQGTHDVVSYDDSLAPVIVDLFLNLATSGDASGDQISGFEDLIGSDFGDQLFGSEAANLILGGAGADLVEGDGGNDTLSGGTENDTLRGFNNDDSISGGGGADFIDGGYDDDIMNGGTGRDTFRFEVWSVFGEHGADTIQDFNVNEDRLLLDGLSSVSDLTVSQVGANTLITYDWWEGSITLNNVNANDLLAHAQTAITFG
jgi:Ca2+-binding RTX toxin-like protein